MTPVFVVYDMDAIHIAANHLDMDIRLDALRLWELRPVTKQYVVQEVMLTLTLAI